MATKERYSKHYEENTAVKASPESVFSYADHHANFSSHMNTSSWMLGGGKMNTQMDSGKFKEVGSHIEMSGSVFGVNLYLDEVITEHEPPKRKAWETVGDINLLVIDHYKLGFEIEPENTNSRFRVYIDYNLPQSARTRILGYSLGGMYAKWCVSQMINGVKEHFK